MKVHTSFFGFAFVLLIGIIFVYSNHFSNSFHFDDSHTIVNNIYIRNINNIPLFFKDGTTFSSLPANQSYRPLVSTSLALDYFFGKGLTPFYFHLSTFILFIVQGILMFFFYLKILEISYPNKWNPFVCLAAVGWYMLHPANAETINYIIARSDTLSTLFTIVGFILYIYSPTCRSWRLYLIPIAIGTLAKPTAIMFAPLLFIYRIYFETNDSGRIVLERSLDILRKTLPDIFVCLFLFLFVRKMDSETFTPGGTSIWCYFITQPYVMSYYAKSFFLPLWLSADSDLSAFSAYTDYRIYLGFLFILIMLSVAYYTMKNIRTRPISFGILWFFITLLPTSSFIPLAEVVNDHRMFFPFFGLAIAVTWSFALLLIRIEELVCRNRGLFVSTIFIFFGAYSYGTYQRNNIWKNEETLWYDVTIKSPNNGRGLMNYGLTLMAKGNYTDAEIYFNKALKLYPKYSYLHINLGILKDALGAKNEAEQYFKNAISYNNIYPGCYFYYGRFLNKNGRVNEAIDNLKKAINLSQAHIDARYLLMEIYYIQPDYENLGKLAEQTLTIVPRDSLAIMYLTLAKKNKDKSQIDIASEKAHTVCSAENYIELSLAYYRGGNFLACIKACEDALKLKPNSAEAYNNICAAYNSLGEWNKAMEACNKSIQLKPNFQLAKNNLNWAMEQKKKRK